MNETVKSILGGMDITKSDAIAHVAARAAQRLVSEGKREAYRAADGQMSDELASDMVELEKLLGRQPSHREERYVERCVDAYLAQPSTIGAALRRE